MDIEMIGFVVGMIGALLMKASMGEMKAERVNGDLKKSLGREPDNKALRVFTRGLGFILAGLGIETYARLFLN